MTAYKTPKPEPFCTAAPLRRPSGDHRDFSDIRIAAATCHVKPPPDAMAGAVCTGARLRRGSCDLPCGATPTTRWSFEMGPGSPLRRPSDDGLRDPTPCMSRAPPPDTMVGQDGLQHRRRNLDARQRSGSRRVEI